MLIFLLSFSCNYIYVVSVQRFSLPLGDWVRLGYSIVALPVPSI